MTLESIYDVRKSFHGKAEYEERGKIKTLYSYREKILSIKGDQIKRFWNGYSATTQRHINEFMRQFSSNHEGLNKREFLGLPLNKWKSLDEIKR